MKFHPEESPSQIEDEALEYLLSPLNELPTFDAETTLLDTFWVQMSDRKLPTGQHQYKSLSKLAISTLSLAHSNADAERSFSVLRKIQSDSRHNLGADTVHALLSCKFNNNDCCRYKPDKVVLQDAKQACVNVKQTEQC